MRSEPPVDRLSNSLTEALRLLGFSTPFVYAAAVYGLFHYLDTKASGDAKRAIGVWFRPFSYDKTAVAAAIIDVFDRLYTRPLLGWTAFFRSAVFTTVLMFFCFYEFSYLLDEFHRTRFIEDYFLQWVTNIASDYLSLFVVRRWLIMSGERPLTALVTGTMVGGLIVLTMTYVFIFIYYLLRDQVWLGPLWFISWILDTTGSSQTRELLLPAIAVHSWLILFGISVLLVQATNAFLWAVNRTQWFIKQGRRHPLDAIGYVGAVVVFATTITLQRIF